MEQAAVAVYDRMSGQASQIPVGMRGQAEENHPRNTTIVFWLNTLSLAPLKQAFISMELILSYFLSEVFLGVKGALLMANSSFLCQC